MTQAMMPKRLKMVKIEDDIRVILSTRTRCNENRLQITGDRLDPKLYKRVNAVLAHLGGKWTSGNTQAHIFDQPAQDVLREALACSAVVNRKQSYQFFETPDHVADRIAELADIRPGMLVLEPSAGRGAIVKAIQRIARPKQIFAVELDKKHGDALKELGCVYIYGDFLTTELGRDGFDRVAMNPPFTGGQDAEHVMHAFTLLNPKGRLVSVVADRPTSRPDRKAIRFMEFVQEHIINDLSLDRGTFLSSGTDVPTRIIVLQKD